MAKGASVCGAAQEKSSREAASIIGRAMAQPAKSAEAELNSPNFDDIIDDTEGELVGVVNAKP